MNGNPGEEVTPLKLSYTKINQKHKIGFLLRKKICKFLFLCNKKFPRISVFAPSILLAIFGSTHQYNYICPLPPIVSVSRDSSSIVSSTRLRATPHPTYKDLSPSTDLE